MHFQSNLEALTSEDPKKRMGENHLIFALYKNPFLKGYKAKGQEQLTCVTSGEPLHSVESRLTMVDTWLLSLESAAVAGAPAVLRPGLHAEDGPDTVPPAAAIRDRSSSVSPCLASGAGSTPRRVNRSASDAKQRRAPSET